MAIALTSTSTSGAFVVNGQNVVQADSNGNVSIRTNNTVQTPESFIKQNLNATGSAPIYAARAWVNFNGTGTVAIRASGNVSSITDNGAGDYTVNFTTAMPDVNYSPIMTAGGAPLDDSGTAKTTIAFRFNVYSFASVKTDYPNVNVAIFR
jgi:hypothetical protein